jgi:DNA polymerase V
MEIYKIKPHAETSVMVALASAPCGSPQDICTELEIIDLNEFITGGKSGVFFIRARGDSMEAEIRRGDLMVVNRNVPVDPGDAIVAFVNGDISVKIYKPDRNGLKLVPKNAKYKSQIITAQDDFEIFGVVTDVIHNLKKI